MKTPEQLSAAIAVETADFLQYRNSDQMRQYVKMLDAMIDNAMDGLVTVTPQRLEFKQGALRQLIALRSAVVENNPHVNYAV